MSVKDFSIITKLGEGAYSSVYKVKRVADQQEYALKKVNLANLSEKEKQNALNEVRILASIRCLNIVAYKEVFLDGPSNSLCIVMEYVNYGDLYQKVVDCQKKGQLITEPEIWSILIQIVKGLKALHDLKIFHRDLKSANVFLAKDGMAKLGDMNVSKLAKKGLLYTQTGTPYYASPEVWKDQPYDQKSDIWSLGCVLYEMTTLKPQLLKQWNFKSPFRAEDMEGLYKKVIRGYYPKIPSQFSQDLNNIIRALLQVAPHLRPSCDQILHLPAVTRRMDDRLLIEADEGANDLLSTIRVPKNMLFLTERLPKPNYTLLKLKKIDKLKFVQTLVVHATHGSSVEEDPNDSYINPVARLPRLPRRNERSLVGLSADVITDQQGDTSGERNLKPTGVHSQVTVINHSSDNERAVNRGLSKKKPLNKARGRVKLDIEGESKPLQSKVKKYPVLLEQEENYRLPQIGRVKRSKDGELGVKKQDTQSAKQLLPEIGLSIRGNRHRYNNDVE